MKKMLWLLSLTMFVSYTLSAQDQDRDRTRQRDRIHQEDHLRLLDGKLYLWKEGKAVQLMEQYKLKNGTIVNTDGSYQLQNQKRYQLRSGECLDMDGNRYLNQNRFNNRKMMSNKQIERVQTRFRTENRNRATQQPGRGGRSD